MPPEDTGVPAQLDGLRVLDLSNYTPGPFATQILADLGATVLKVERPPHGDLERLSVPEYFRAYNRGKHSIALDLRDPGDRAELHKLAAEADVVVEGFRPGVAERIGAGFAELGRLNPRLVYVSLPGVPAASPFAHDRAHDSEFQSRVGALAVLAGEGGPTYDVPYPVSDYAAGMYATIGILAALARPAGAPVRIEAPCFSAALAWMYPMLCRLVHPVGTPSRGRMPGVGVFVTSDGRHLTMSTIEDRGWVELCRAIGRPDVADDPGLATLAQRKERFGELDDMLRSAIAARPLAHWETVLRDHEVSVGPVRTPHEALEDELVRSLGMLHEGEEPGSAPALGLPLNGLRSVVHRHVPAIDEDGDAVRADGWTALGRG
ncbi:crotonobetainyl-CoA:carnitine CoA-transferase CaiB-like acyl-CoA transferase [Amycolatopsis bartoniae]|uniref:CoA transferase n=1 Tax=Amycolatopsis bartoniae TaxID=941986 RepID=A0A8H9M7V1_9PSEU|nr:CoA transferase [Amycolatopsis bartoniae]MBB2939749.1 crotonobetainyl-CoA:carnitine CoA-transferase CaiB-like acyl-CoA transferase [Amycolatopsis bartoniae]TVT08354.1 CoA transferase [Amycolatopsis bartoniae]GHF36080.1 CoA transferase [Amycolatopsis bartoniae]